MNHSRLITTLLPDGQKAPYGKVPAGQPKGGGRTLAERYLCPICRSNRSSFEVIFKLSREIRKDPDTGEELFQADAMSVVLRNDRPELDIRCLQCGYTGYEGLFVKAVKQGAS